MHIKKIMILGLRGQILLIYLGFVPILTFAIAMKYNFVAKIVLSLNPV